MTLPPNFDQYQPANYPAPTNARASRAGILLMILGLLAASFGLCNGITTFRTSPEKILEQQRMLMPSDQPMPQISPQAMRTLAAIFAAAIVLTGFVLLGLGITVRSGSSAAAVVATIIVGLILAALALIFLISLIATFAAPAFGAVLCLLTVPMFLFSLEFFWLIQASRAARAAPGASQLQSQYAQYWQYYQQQQQSQQTGPYTPPAPPAHLSQPPQYFPPPPPPPPQGEDHAPPPPR